MALTDYDKKNLSSSDQKKIQAATDKWNAANAKGDTAGMASAAAEAAAIRNNAGYKTDSSGNYSGSTTSSGSTSTKNSQYTNYTPTGNYNDTGLSQWAQNQINTYKTQYNNAIASGDTAAAEAAHKAAEALRAKYGYSGGTDGSQYISLPQETQPAFSYSEPQPTYTSNYDPQIDVLLNQILNRDSFSYDVASDPLYQQYAQMYQREGDRAMRDTMAEAAAGAGGMNSYAITAAQQANNYYGAQLNDKIPELYNAAYQMHLQDIDNKVRDLGLLQNMDATQYNRYRDTMADWKDDRNFAYDIYRDDVGDAQWQQSFDYNAFVGDRDYNFTSDWKNKEFDFTVGQTELENSRYDQESAKEEARYLISLGITPDAELIKRAGLNETTVALEIAAVQAANAKKGGTTTKPKETPVTGDGGSVAGLGLGPISDEMLLNLVESGVVIINADDTVEWADGYGPSNYKSALDDSLGELVKNRYVSGLTKILGN